MRNRWIVPGAVALLSLALVLLWSQLPSQASVPRGAPMAAGPPGARAPVAGSQTVYEVTLDGAERGVGRRATVEDVSLQKTAVSTDVLAGEVVTYTLTFSNSGDVTRDLDLVVDVLPPDVTFKRMTGASDVIANPDGSTGTITWLGPFSIDPLAEIVVQYEVTMPLVVHTVILVNEAWGQMDAATVGPDSVSVKVAQRDRVYFPVVTRNYASPRFTVSKSAHPQAVFNTVARAEFTYTVEFYNEGTVPGALVDIRDTLPTGFRFGGMVTDQSDVDSAPAGVTGEIVWTGPFIVPGESALTLVYRVTSAPTNGTYVNSATATTVEGKGAPPKTPGQAVVSITEPIYLEENWEDPSPYWQPYLDYWRLNPEQWYLEGGVGVGGSTALKHTYRRGVDDPRNGAHDALYMYLGPGSEGWTNYRYEAKVKMNHGNSQGLWFRGAYEESTTGRDPIQGYYLIWRTNGDYLKLSRIPKDGEGAYDFREPKELVAVAHTFNTDEWYDIAVEVVGNNIKAFVNDELVIERNDATWATGTVGAFCYQVTSALWDDIVVTELP